jgi:hypothetical protein
MHSQRAVKDGPPHRLPEPRILCVYYGIEASNGVIVIPELKRRPGIRGS